MFKARDDELPLIAGEFVWFKSIVKHPPQGRECGEPPETIACARSASHTQIQTY